MRSMLVQRFRGALLAYLVFAACFAAFDARAQGTAEDAIRASLRATWERPGAPLTVDPVVRVGRFAMAGWVQGDRGGRALLRDEHGKWVTFICGGDGLKAASALREAGVPAADADRLAAAWQAAEAKVSPVLRSRFSLFEGIVRVDASHGPGNAHGPASHAPAGHGASSAPRHGH